MNKVIFTFFFVILSLSSQAQTSIWNASLQTDTLANIPFLFSIDSVENKLFVLNGEESIEAINLEMTKDSLNFEMPVFGSVVKAVVKENELAKRLGKTIVNIEGFWYKYPNRPNYKMPFAAYEIDLKNWNRVSENAPENIDGKWEVTFTNPDGSTYPAIGEFIQNGHDLSGTFMTKTGDYRYLSGKIYESTFYLSCFDGAHAFFFKGDVGDDEIFGEFFAGKSWREDFVAVKNDEVVLDNPYDLTYMNENAENFDFSFVDFETKEAIALNDKRFEGKGVVIQILGTWCPNCMDETALYTDLAKKYKEQGIEFIGVAFERSENLEDNLPAIDRYKQHFELSYPILFGGKASKKIASEQFPMLNKIISFPTTIVLNKAHEVVKIHTGFNGPATSEYDKFVDSFIALLNKISED